MVIPRVTVSQPRSALVMVVEITCHRLPPFHQQHLPTPLHTDQRVDKTNQQKHRGNSHRPSKMVVLETTLSFLGKAYFFGARVPGRLSFSLTSRERLSN